jgi:hypothetical protein
MLRALRIKTKNKSERHAISTALDDPETRALVVVVGTLLPLSDGARGRILDSARGRILGLYYPDASPPPANTVTPTPAKES